MARIRTIKPEYWTDERIGSLEMGARLLFIGMWNFADDEGVVIANPIYLKSQIFPYDEALRLGVVKGWLDALVKARFLVPLSFEEQSYYVIRTFRSHQVINRPTKGKIPSSVICDVLSGSVHGELSEPSLNTHAGKERKGKEGNGKEEREDACEQKVKRFTPPSIEEVQEYFVQKGFPLSEVQKFWAYYDSNGWRVGRNPMKSWTSAASGWVSRLSEFGSKPHKTNPLEIGKHFEAPIPPQINPRLDKLKELKEASSKGELDPQSNRMMKMLERELEQETA